MACKTVGQWALSAVVQMVALSDKFAAVKMAVMLDSLKAVVTVDMRGSTSVG